LKTNKPYLPLAAFLQKSYENWQNAYMV